MGKIKTHKATAKRFTVTGSGRVKINHTDRRHKLGIKASKRKMHLRKAGYLSESMAPTVKKLMPYAK
ncbi:MAG: 50S ribosomal protein L35 [Clostridia bacterium]|nr:50S ribosomal protein L35 [Clostridia bacterium]